MKGIVKILIIVCCLFFLNKSLLGQTVSLKTNLLYDLTTTMSFGAEVAIGSQWTGDLLLNYNPWQFSNNKKLKHWMIQPELRYWTCEKMFGHFFGLHGIYSKYNMGGIKMLGLGDYRYEGYLVGGGISYGYQWILSDRWSLETTIGLGYLFMDYSKYRCEECGEKISDEIKNYFGPTKLGVSLIYFLK